jgi:hypothetical protein
MVFEITISKGNDWDTIDVELDNVSSMESFFRRYMDWGVKSGFVEIGEVILNIKNIIKVEEAVIGKSLYETMAELAKPSK